MTHDELEAELIRAAGGDAHGWRLRAGQALGLNERTLRRALTERDRPVPEGVARAVRAHVAGRRLDDAAVAIGPVDWLDLPDWMAIGPAPGAADKRGTVGVIRCASPRFALFGMSTGQAADGGPIKVRYDRLSGTVEPSQALLAEGVKMLRVVMGQASCSEAAEDQGDHEDKGEL